MANCKYCGNSPVSNIELPCGNCKEKLEIFRKIRLMGFVYKKRYNKK